MYISILLLLLHNNYNIYDYILYIMIKNYNGHYNMIITSIYKYLIKLKVNLCTLTENSFIY